MTTSQKILQAIQLAVGEDKDILYIVGIEEQVEMVQQTLMNILTKLHPEKIESTKYGIIYLSSGTHIRIKKLKSNLLRGIPYAYHIIEDWRDTLKYSSVYRLLDVCQQLLWHRKMHERFENEMA